MSFEHHQIPADLLAWYDLSARDLPWRIGPAARKAGIRPDAYRVWLSEIMLQQTTVAAVKPYFERFVARWRSVEDLADAETDDVMAEWAGLGYYSRARNLHACAKIVAHGHGGRFPPTAALLKALPGIGDYTSAAIASIAFDEPAPVVDGNIERVVTRLYRIKAPLPAAKTAIRRTVAAITPTERPGDFAQAMMDLGATICVPRTPSCLICPIAAHCAARSAGDQALYPVKPPKRAVPSRVGAAFVALRRADGAVWLRRRPAPSMLGGMAEAPSTDWSARADGETHAASAPFTAGWVHAGTVEHGFTHFKLALEVYRAEVETVTGVEGWWAPPDRIAEQGLPTLMRKVVARAIAAEPALAKEKRPARKQRTASIRLEAEPEGSFSLVDDAAAGTRRPPRPRRRTRRTSARWSKG
ncbi:A/G-specific adenine glycosylase [Fulvimarina sp. 2208YS6-2-32]|uniref:Adenine DNA glycosylase n=1 Tax=Fulvimarina uroteuthidis TaxID=3098149 RepID=A0ABU5I5K6_9HYPH|nr:A/G-specific adenine glycosylase [Fulvimarina sp. 2208YS6-2-32]MDY8109431.1 A/G-specific adenine glycosylase [Fulvimarina sp. 2208YS6-2-32]